MPKIAKGVYTCYNHVALDEALAAVRASANALLLNASGSHRRQSETK